MSVADYKNEPVSVVVWSGWGASVLCRYVSGQANHCWIWNGSLLLGTKFTKTENTVIGEFPEHEPLVTYGCNEEATKKYARPCPCVWVCATVCVCLFSVKNSTPWAPHSHTHTYTHNQKPERCLSPRLLQAAPSLWLSGTTDSAGVSLAFLPNTLTRYECCGYQSLPMGRVNNVKEPS